jgi:hypothetical protein
MSKLEDFAEVVRLTIKAALAPEQARNARLDQALTEARAEVSLLRERLAIVESRLDARVAPKEEPAIEVTDLRGTVQ